MTSLVIERLSALSDNYIFLLYEPMTRIVAAVDPAIADPVLSWLQTHDATLTAIFNTHHHGDHVGGNRSLLNQFPQAQVYGGAEDRGRIPGQTHFLQDGDRVEFGDRTAQVFFVPGHTKAHIAYYFPPQISDQPGELFCGDTLFAGGCGRLFEGTPAQMLASLAKLRALPDQTRVWCAHEYTLNNLKFALTVEPENTILRTRFEHTQQARHRQEATVPSLLGLEKQTNPFLRWDAEGVMAIARSNDPVTTFATIRRAKDQF